MMRSLDELTIEQKKFVNEYVMLNGGDECCLELLVESFETLERNTNDIEYNKS
jgi:hypothetical protein